MVVSKLADGVFRVPTVPGDRNNVFVIRAADGGLTVVDTGAAADPAALWQALAELGAGADALRQIVLTHAHPDHVRGAAELRRRTGAPLIVHEDDQPWLRAGRVPSGGRSSRLMSLADRLPKLHWPLGLEADLAVGDGQRLPADEGLVVIHTPGHTPGHIAVLHEPTGVLLAGDAIFRGPRGFSTGSAGFARDPDRQRRSLACLPRTFTAVGLAHGTPVTGAGIGELRQWLDAQ